MNTDLFSADYDPFGDTETGAPDGSVARPPEAADARLGEPSGSIDVERVPPALFGWDPTPGVVAVEIQDREAVLFLEDSEASHDPSGEVPRRIQQRRPFQPWLLTSLAGREEAGDELPSARWTRLRGEGLCWMAEFPAMRQFMDARDLLRGRGLPLLGYGHPVKQFLVRSGVTHFKGMEFGGIRRLQFDIETTGLNPGAPDARVLLIATTDNQGGEWVFSGDERAMIERFVHLFEVVDPDVVEGHNLFGFDFPYLAARARATGVRLQLGRDGSAPIFSRERNVPIGGISRPFQPVRLWGRHVLDTLLAVQRFDISRGELESNALKEVAIHYGLAAPDRVYLDRSVLSEIWKSDPERVKRYAVQDVDETRRLAELTLPTEFYQAQMVPESYENVATGGSGEKINSLLVREYLRQGCAVPQGQPSTAYPGGFTEVRKLGVLRRVVKADVESLYPRIMLNYGIRPAADVLDVFLPMLSDLTIRRLDAKARARTDGPERAYWDGLQGSFKLLINSFYGYLGAQFHFNDYDAAARVTLTGQELVKKVAEELEETGSTVIEIDTDGVYFVPPEGTDGEEAESEYIARVGAVLPTGIRLAHDGRYAAMLSLKIKNYVLIGYDGKRVVRGASLRSRADERFGREFLMRAVDYLFRGDSDGLRTDFEELSEKIRTGTLPLEQFVRRERITEKTLQSTSKRRSREAARDVRVGETIRVYERTDGTLGLAEEYAGDEDRWHYLEKLHRFAARLQEALGPEFERVLPRPSRREYAAEQAGQGTLF